MSGKAIAFFDEEKITRILDFFTGGKMERFFVVM